MLEIDPRRLGNPFHGKERQCQNTRVLVAVLPILRMHRFLSIPATLVLAAYDVPTLLKEGNRAQAALVAKWSLIELCSLDWYIQLQLAHDLCQDVVEGRKRFVRTVLMIASRITGHSKIELASLLCRAGMEWGVSVDDYKDERWIEFAGKITVGSIYTFVARNHI